MKSQSEFLNLVKTNGCVTCHQLGNKATRTIPKALGEFKNGHEAWTRRIQSGQAGLNMVNTMDRMGTQGTLKMFGDWTDRVAKGELPATKPQRPQGVERNAVVTVWDWSNPKAYLHDATAADKRNPTLNANGLVFGATENSTDMVPVLDPVKNIAYEVKLPVRDPKTPSDGPVLAPSAYSATRRSGTPRPVPTACTTTRKAASGSPLETGLRPTPTSARRAPTIRPRRCIRSIRRTVRSRCTTRSRRSS